MNKNFPANHLGRRVSFIACLLWMSAVSLHGCSGCEPDDDETLIRILVGQAVDRAEKHNISELFALATTPFVANPGNYDRRSCKAMLLVMLRRYGTFRIVHPAYGVTISDDGKSAQLTIPFLIVVEGKSAPDIREFADDPTRWLQEASKGADPFILDANLVKRDGEWKVENVHITGRRSVGL